MFSAKTAKAAKTIAKVGLGTAAAVMGAGALVYECALNPKVHGLFVNYFDDRPDPTQENLAKETPSTRTRARIR